MPRRKLEDFPRELVGRRISLPWETGGSLEALVVSYKEKTGVLPSNDVVVLYQLFIYLFLSCLCHSVKNNGVFGMPMDIRRNFREGGGFVGRFLLFSSLPEI